MDLRGHQQIERCLRQEGLPSYNIAVKPETRDLPTEGVEYLSVRFVANGKNLKGEKVFIQGHDVLNALGRAGLMVNSYQKSGGPALEYLDMYPDTEIPGVYNMTFRDTNY